MTGVDVFSGSCWLDVAQSQAYLVVRVQLMRFNQMDINAAPSDANSATSNALREFMRIDEPEYALLIDAPWGAGKTFFVKRECNLENEDGKIRYVSLYGVADVIGFRRALLKDGLTELTPSAVETLGNTISKGFKLGELGSLARDVMEERLLKILPGTIIFDDLERSMIDPQILLGLINDFVEHKRKRVIILADSESHKIKDVFLKHKEKVIGRTLSLQPDFENAFPFFISKMPEGRGKTYFGTHEKIVADVFQESGHKNLRLLRNAVRECGLILDRIDEDLHVAKEPISRFVKTYMALAMALAKGEIQTQDLAKRSNWRIASSPDNEDGLEPIRRIFKRHHSVDIVDNSGSIFPCVLHEALFINGYAETALLNLILRETGQFTQQDENPLWKRMFFWRECGWEDLATVVKQGKFYIFEEDAIEPGPFLHITFGLLRIQENGGLCVSKTDLVQKILDRLRHFGKNQSIPGAKFAKDFGWDGLEEERFSFGSCVYKWNDTFRKIAKEMQTVQLSIFESSLPTLAEKLVSNFESDLDEFEQAISSKQRGHSFSHISIFEMLDEQRFSKATLEYLRQGEIDRISKIFLKISDRHSSDGTWEKEKAWFKKVRCKLRQLASQEDRLAAAQVNLFLSYNWNFEKASSPAG